MAKFSNSERGNPIRRRIQELALLPRFTTCVAMWLVSTSALAGHWVPSKSVGENPNAALCTVLKKHLDAEPCMGVGLQSYPEFSSPPWERLDPQLHLELIAKLLAYWFTETPTNLDPYRHGGRCMEEPIIIRAKSYNPDGASSPQHIPGCDDMKERYAEFTKRPPPPPRPGISMRKCAI